MEKEYSVYSHTNLINGKKYIGITKQKNPENRWLKGKGYQNNVHFQRAIEKYGWDSFDHEILASNLTKEEACDMEINLIDKYHTTDPAFGYNNTKGGEGVSGYHHTEETKKAISEKMKGENNPNYNGKTCTPEQMEKLRAANLGSKHSEEHKRKIADALRGRKHHTEETKIKMSEKFSRPIRRDDGVVYPSVKCAAAACGVTYTAIVNSMKRGQKSCGFHWEYV